MSTEIIKPNKQNNYNKKSVLTPILYLLLGIILAFKSNEAVTLIFYLLGILITIYGIKGLIDYTRFKQAFQYKNINLSIAIVSIIVGVLLIVLAPSIEIGLRYVVGFFLIFLGVTKLLNQISLGNYFNLAFVTNIILVILGIFSIFVSNIILVIAGWILIANALLLFWDYFKK